MKKMCVGSREVTILQGGGWQAKQKIRKRKLVLWGKLLLRQKCRVSAKVFFDP